MNDNPVQKMPKTYQYRDNVKSLTERTMTLLSQSPTTNPMYVKIIVIGDRKVVGPNFTSSANFFNKGKTSCISSFVSKDETNAYTPADATTVSKTIGNIPISITLWDVVAGYDYEKFRFLYIFLL